MELGSFNIDFARGSRRSGRRGSTRWWLPSPRSPSPHQRQVVPMPPRNVVPKPRAGAGARRSGSRALRRGTRSSRPREQGHGALAGAVHRPRGGAPGWVDRTAPAWGEGESVDPVGLRCRPGRSACVTPMMSDTRRVRGRCAAGWRAGNFFGYSLRLLVVFSDHAPGARTSGGSSSSAATRSGFARDIVAADDAPLGVQICSSRASAALRGAIGTPDQIARPDRALRGRRGRPADLRLAGGRQPPRAHLRERSSCSHPR